MHSAAKRKGLPAEEQNLNFSEMKRSTSSTASTASTGPASARSDLKGTKNPLQSPRGFVRFAAKGAAKRSPSIRQRGLVPSESQPLSDAADTSFKLSDAPHTSFKAAEPVDMTSLKQPSTAAKTGLPKRASGRMSTGSFEGGQSQGASKESSAGGKGDQESLRRGKGEEENPGSLETSAAAVSRFKKVPAKVPAKATKSDDEPSKPSQFQDEGAADADIDQLRQQLSAALEREKVLQRLCQALEDAAACSHLQRAQKDAEAEKREQELQQRCEALEEAAAEKDEELTDMRLRCESLKSTLSGLQAALTSSLSMASLVPNDSCKFLESIPGASSVPQLQPSSPTAGNVACPESSESPRQVDKVMDPNDLAPSARQAVPKLRLGLVMPQAQAAMQRSPALNTMQRTPAMSSPRGVQRTPALASSPRLTSTGVASPSPPPVAVTRMVSSPAMVTTPRVSSKAQPQQPASLKVMPPAVMSPPRLSTGMAVVNPPCGPAPGMFPQEPMPQPSPCVRNSPRQNLASSPVMPNPWSPVMLRSPRSHTPRTLGTPGPVQQLADAPKGGSFAAETPPLFQLSRLESDSSLTSLADVPGERDFGDKTATDLIANGAPWRPHSAEPKSRSDLLPVHAVPMQRMVSAPDMMHQPTPRKKRGVSQPPIQRMVSSPAMMSPVPPATMQRMMSSHAMMQPGSQSSSTRSLSPPLSHQASMQRMLSASQMGSPRIAATVGMVGGPQITTKLAPNPVRVVLSPRRSTGQRSSEMAPRGQQRPTTSPRWAASKSLRPASITLY